MDLLHGVDLVDSLCLLPVLRVGQDLRNHVVQFVVLTTEFPDLCDTILQKSVVHVNLLEYENKVLLMSGKEDTLSGIFSCPRFFAISRKISRNWSN